MFRWNDRDAGKLSGARSNGSIRVSAADAYKHATEIEKRGSNGTWGVQASRAGELGSQFIDDSATLPPPPASPPGHTFLDVRHVSAGSAQQEKLDRERIRARLLLAAQRYFPPLIR